MNFFERLWKKPTEGQQKPTEVSEKRSENLFQIGFDILQSLKHLSEEQREELFNSLEEHKKYLETESGSRFITPAEADFIIQTARRVDIRPVEIIDLNTEEFPSEILKTLNNKYKNSDKKPLLFVLGSNEEKLKKTDPSWEFDSILRSLPQHNGWSIFITGEYRKHPVKNLPVALQACLLGQSYS